MDNEYASRLKQRIRNKVWTSLQDTRSADPGRIFDRIPSFFGADEAAVRLAGTDVWRSTGVIKSVPDRARLPVRVQALRDRKIVYMAVPKLAAVKPFYLLDPERLTASPEESATSAGAKASASSVDVDAMRGIGLVVCGSVAVDRRGVRIGKGAGYSDIEMAILQDAGLISSSTVIVTTVHDLQVMDEDLPETEHDFRVDLVVTPTRIISCQGGTRPAGLIWEHLSEDKIVRVGRGRVTRISPGRFPLPLSRTGRATFTASGSPRSGRGYAGRGVQGVGILFPR